MFKKIFILLKIARRLALSDAIEIISGRQSLAQTDKLRQLAHKFSLLASVGSDFHCDGRYLADIGINSGDLGSIPSIWSDDPSV